MFVASLRIGMTTVMVGAAGAVTLDELGVGESLPRNSDGCSSSEPLGKLVGGQRRYDFSRPGVGAIHRIFQRPGVPEWLRFVPPSAI